MTDAAKQHAEDRAAHAKEIESAVGKVNHHLGELYKSLQEVDTLLEHPLEGKQQHNQTEKTFLTTLLWYVGENTRSMHRYWSAERKWREEYRDKL